MTGLRVVPFALEHVDAWEALFAACGSTCFCRYWHFAGTTNEWLARSAFSPGENLAEQKADLAAGDDRARGVVALDGDDVVGWMKLAPRRALPKLRGRSVYRGRDLGDDEGVYSVGCFLVHPARRHGGVAAALLRDGILLAQRWGARAIEAYPHRRGEALRDEEVWMGPPALFVQQGFREFAGDDPYPVLRLTLCAPGPEHA